MATSKYIINGELLPATLARPAVDHSHLHHNTLPNWFISKEDKQQIEEKMFCVEEQVTFPRVPHKPRPRPAPKKPKNPPKAKPPPPQNQERTVFVTTGGDVIRGQRARQAILKVDVREVIIRTGLGEHNIGGELLRDEPAGRVLGTYKRRGKKCSNAATPPVTQPQDATTVPDATRTPVAAKAQDATTMPVATGEQDATVFQDPAAMTVANEAQGITVVQDATTIPVITRAQDATMTQEATTILVATETPGPDTMAVTTESIDAPAVSAVFETPQSSGTLNTEAVQDATNTPLGTEVPLDKEGPDTPTTPPEESTIDMPISDGETSSNDNILIEVEPPSGEVESSVKTEESVADDSTAEGRKAVTFEVAREKTCSHDMMLQCSKCEKADPSASAVAVGVDMKYATVSTTGASETMKAPHASVTATGAAISAANMDVKGVDVQLDINASASATGVDVKAATADTKGIDVQGGVTVSAETKVIDVQTVTVEAKAVSIQPKASGTASAEALVVKAGSATVIGAQETLKVDGIADAQGVHVEVGTATVTGLSTDQEAKLAGTAYGIDARVGQATAVGIKEELTVKATAEAKGFTAKAGIVDVTGKEGEVGILTDVSVVGGTVETATVKVTGVKAGASARGAVSVTGASLETAKVEVTGVDSSLSSGVGVDVSGVQNRIGTVDLYGHRGPSATARADLGSGVDALQFSAGTHSGVGVSYSTRPQFGCVRLSVGPPNLSIGAGGLFNFGLGGPPRVEARAIGARVGPGKGKDGGEGGEGGGGEAREGGGGGGAAAAGGAGGGGGGGEGGEGGGGGGGGGVEQGGSVGEGGEGEAGGAGGGGGGVEQGGREGEGGGGEAGEGGGGGGAAAAGGAGGGGGSGGGVEQGGREGEAGGGGGGGGEGGGGGGGGGEGAGGGGGGGGGGGAGGGGGGGGGGAAAAGGRGGEGGKRGGGRRGGGKQGGSNGEVGGEGGKGGGGVSGEGDSGEDGARGDGLPRATNDTVVNIAATGDTTEYLDDTGYAHDGLELGKLLGHEMRVAGIMLDRNPNETKPVTVPEDRESAVEFYVQRLLPKKEQLDLKRALLESVADREDGATATRDAVPQRGDVRGQGTTHAKPVPSELLKDTQTSTGAIPSHSGSKGSTQPGVSGDSDRKTAQGAPKAQSRKDNRRGLPKNVRTMADWKDEASGSLDIVHNRNGFAEFRDK